MVKIGVVGGGQLARMMIPAAINLGFDVKVFAESSDASASLAVTQVGDYRNETELVGFASEVDVITFDHEHVPTSVLEAVRRTGVAVYPSPEALRLTHNKIDMRARLQELGLPQPLWTVSTSAASFPEDLGAVGGFPCVAKKPVGGYDGKGVRIITSPEEIEDWLSDGPVLLEEKVEFVRELAQLGARSPSGEWQTWDPVETTQVGGVCSEVIAPAPGLTEGLDKESRHLASQIAREVDVVGVLAVELFETADGRLLVNELAMRPHNSGHVFTELSQTSQFEQHLRAVAGFPLGATGFLAPRGVMVNLFGGIEEDRMKQALRRYQEAKIHSYQKSARPGRKAGHVVAVGDELLPILEMCREVAAVIHGGDYDA
jgi:5-(carboxyamino)imidazole ribonucleotide synthase